jgi:hypothetical protein
MMILAQRKYLNHNHFDLQDKSLPIILAQSLTPQKNFVAPESVPVETGLTRPVAIRP